MANRRDFLKMFGIGAAIVPILPGGVIVPEAKAVLLEPPKVELADAPPLMSFEQMQYLRSGHHKVTCFIETEKDTAIFRGYSFIVKTDYELQQVNGQHRFGAGIAASNIKVKWTMEGEMVPDIGGRLVDMYWL